MPWETPQLSEVRKLVRDHVAANFPGADATVPNSVLRVLSDSNAALAHLTLLYIDWLSKQLLPDTAEHEWLDRFGKIWLNGRKAATFSEGSATFTGLEGIVIPSGTRVSSGNRIEYETTGDITLSDVPTPASIRALDAGEAGNQLPGALLSLVNAIDSVDGNAIVVTLTGGVDEESDDDLRGRVLERIRQPPMGGNKTDYVHWAKTVAGVTRAWSFPLEMGMGTVTVRFMMDDLRSVDEGFPNEDDVAAVRAYMDTVRPVAIKDFFVEAPLPYDLGITISNLELDNASVRASIEASIRRMLLKRSFPGQTIYHSWVSEAISSATGEDHHDVVINALPSGEVDLAMPAPGYMARLDTIIYT